MGAPAIRRFLALAGFVMFALSTGIEDAAAQWTYRVATDPYIRNIGVFLNTPVTGTNTLIVSTLTDGMYKVVDTGNSQTSTFQKISNGLPIVEVRTHSSISTTDFTTMYAGTDGAGLFKTSDGGANWLPLNGSGVTALGCANVRSINFDATTPRTLIIGTACRNNSGFYKSIDDGLTWSRLGNATLPDDVAVSALTRDVASNTYFLASSNYGIYKSIDAGTTWSTANSGITAPNGTLNTFNIQFTSAATAGPPALAPTNLLAYVHGSGMYRSTNTGATWTLSNAGLPTSLPGGSAALGGIAKQTNSILYVGLDKEGVYKTIDGGANWTLWGNPLTDDRMLITRTVAIATAGSAYYFGTLNGLAKTTDNATTINGVQMGDGGGRINAITHDRDTPYKAYVTGHTLFRIDYIYGDCSAGCAPMDSGVTGNTIEGVAYQDKSNPATIYVTTTNRGIFKSTNGGTSFSAINNGLPNMIGQSSRLAIDENNAQILYLGLSDATGVFKSTDGGTTWVASNSGLATPEARSINTVTLDHNNSSIVYAATDGGLYKSIDSGATWNRKYFATDNGGSLLPVNALRVRTGNSLELYMGNNNVNANGTLAPSSGLHKSIDGGDNWTNILPSQAVSQVRVLSTGDIYAGISATAGNPAVLLSTNGGTSFAPYSGGLNGSDIRTFGVAADRSTMLSLSLENGLYTHNPAGPPPSVAVSAAITEAPGIFSTVFLGYQTVNTTSASKAVTITNTSATTATIVGFGATNSDNFAVPSHNCPLALAAGASCTVNVTFTPRFAGSSSATLVAVGPVTGAAVNLLGVGITSGQPALLVSNDPGMVPAYPGFYNQQTTREITFGNQAIGTSRTISVTLQNAGTATANISFSGVTAPMSLGGTCGTTIPAGGNCRLDVIYLPTGAGTANQTLNITHDSPFPIQAPFPFLLYGIAENPATDGSLIPAFGAATSPGGAGKAFVSFGPYGVESVDRLALQSDGKIIVLMTARKAVEDGIAVAGVARLNTDGTLDTTWGSAGFVRLVPPNASYVFNGGAGLYVLQPGGKVVVAFAAVGSAVNADLVIYRLLADGQVDTGFGTGGSTIVTNLGFNRLEHYADDRMLATGNADPVNNNKVGLVRLNADGTPDAAFGTAGRVELLVPDVIQLANTQAAIRTRFAADEKIFVGYSYGAGSSRDLALYKLTTSGAIDTTWGSAGRINVAATSLEDNMRNIRVQGDGKILLLSRTERAAGSGNYLWVLARLNADGSPDTLFGTAGLVTTQIGPSTNLAGPLRVTTDGKILVAGRRNCGGACLSGSDGVIVRYNPDGSLDTSFGSGGVKAIVITASFESIGDMAIDTDGTIVAGGQVSQFDADRGDGTTGSTIDNGFVVKIRNTVAPVGLLGVLSRKVHASVPYDLPIAIGNPMKVEPRTIGAGHQIVFEFNQPITSIGSLTTTIGTATATPAGGNDVIVTLSGVPDNQRATISIGSINGNAAANVAVTMGFLVGDVNSTQRVNASDISAVKARASATLTPQNFKYDLSASGAINAQDTSLVKSRSGLVIP